MTTYCEKKLRVKIYFVWLPWSKYTYHLRTEGVHNEPAIQWNGPTCNHKSILPYKIELVKEHKITHIWGQKVIICPKWQFVKTIPKALYIHTLTTSYSKPNKNEMVGWSSLANARVADSDVKCTQKWKVQMEFLAEAWWWQNFMIELC
jgi:hypothetical protein